MGLLLLLMTLIQTNTVIFFHFGLKTQAQHMKTKCIVIKKTFPLCLISPILFGFYFYILLTHIQGYAPTVHLHMYLSHTFIHLDMCLSSTLLSYTFIRIKYLYAYVNILISLLIGYLVWKNSCETTVLCSVYQDIRISSKNGIMISR